MKKYMLLLMILPLAIFSIAQEKFPFIAKNSEEFMNAKPDPGIRNVHVDNSNMVIVKRSKGSESYSVSDVWGFRSRNGNEYRIFGGEEYQVLASGNLCIYAHPVIEVMMSEGYSYPVLKYYFSRRINGEIHELNMDNIRAVFSPTNPKFVDLMTKWKWDNEFIKFDRQNHSFKIEEIYKESKKSANS